MHVILNLDIRDDVVAILQVIIEIYTLTMNLLLVQSIYVATCVAYTTAI